VTFRVLPDAEVETIADVGGGVDVSLNANLAFAAHTPKVDLTAAGIPLAAKAGADVSAVADTHAALGPFHYRLTKAKITHTPMGMEYVRWRIDGAEFFETDGPSLVVILAVPNDVTEVVIDAQMAARRYFRFAAAPLQEKIRRLPARLREFFVKDGAPVPDDTVWDITAQL
jgi:zona occludens toxin (predicted ATPase)